jgi:hypothetical protein
MLYKEESPTGKIRGKAILKRIRRDSGYMMLFRMMKNPKIEDFFLSIMDIIITDLSKYLDETTLENRALREAVSREIAQTFNPNGPQPAGQV